MPDIADRLWRQEHDSPSGRWRVAMPPRGNAQLMVNLGALQYLVDPLGVRAPVVYRSSWIPGRQSAPFDDEWIVER
jgi:hypothetical protein